MKPSLGPLIIATVDKPKEPTVSTNIDLTTPEPTGKSEVRTTLTRGLSRYGPWGYLMLGMLLCGGALLICGLWGMSNNNSNICFLFQLLYFIVMYSFFIECCCRKKNIAVQNDNVENTSTTIASSSNNMYNSLTVPHSLRPPNYDEMDQPPSYAILFPNQK